jgi:hypothetical protein
MTPKDWKEEVATAVAGLGLPWRVFAAWVERDGATCCAELTDTRSGKERTVRLSRQVFASEADRRAEIVRQLQER